MARKLFSSRSLIYHLTHLFLALAFLTLFSALPGYAAIVTYEFRGSTDYAEAGFSSEEGYHGLVSIDTSVSGSAYPYNDLSVELYYPAIREWYVEFASGISFSGSSGSVVLGNDMDLFGDRIVFTMYGSSAEPLEGGRLLTFFQIDLIDREAPGSRLADLLTSDRLPQSVNIGKATQKYGRIVLKEIDDTTPSWFGDDIQLFHTVTHFSRSVPGCGPSDAASPKCMPVAPVPVPATLSMFAMSLLVPWSIRSRRLTKQ